MRIKGWERALADYLAKARRKSFVWGENDCCLFAANGVLAMTGRDLAERFRGYHDEAGAYAALKKCGVETVEEAATQMLGPPIGNNRYMRRGDVCSIENAGALSLGLIDLSGREACLVSRKRGFIVVPLRLIRHVWTV